MTIGNFKTKDDGYSGVIKTLAFTTEAAIVTFRCALR